MSLCKKVSLIALFSLVFVSSPSHAYLDPGSVSLAVQAMVAAFAGAMLTWKHWWYRVKDWCVRLSALIGLKKKKEEQNGLDSESGNLNENEDKKLID